MIVTTLIRVLAGTAVTSAALYSQPAVAGSTPKDLVATPGALSELAKTTFKFEPTGEGSDLLPPLTATALVYRPQETPPAETPLPGLPPPQKTNDWRFDFYAAVWVPLRIKGPIEVGPTTTNVDIDLQTILDDLKFLVEGGFELTNDQWSFLVWGAYFDVGTDVTTSVPSLGTFDTSLDFKATIVDMALAYRIGDWPMGESETAEWGLDLLAGMMVWDLDLEINERTPGGFDPMISRDESWVDLMVGGRLLFKFSDKFGASFRGEVGGFGIGTSSNLTWNISLIGKYKLSDKLDLVFGYRYLDLDWERGSGVDRIGYDWVIHGPILGVDIQF